MRRSVLVEDTTVALQDRLDVVQFRRWTLVLLVVTGLNLVRRAFETGI